MAITFYYAPMSSASVTELVIEELGIPVEKQLIDIRSGATKQGEYLKINPNGLVPCIVHDGVAIWESAAITMYLGELFGVDKQLYPAPGPRRGEAMKWIVWTNVSVGEAMYRRGRAGDWVPAEQRNAAAHAEATADLQKLLGVLDAALADRPFVAGEYTVADAHLGSYLDWVRHTGVDFASFANINAWTARRHERPAAKRLMAQMAG